MIQVIIIGLAVCAGTAYLESKNFKDNTKFGSDLLAFAQTSGKKYVEESTNAIIDSQVETFFTSELYYQTEILQKNSIDYSLVEEAISKKVEKISYADRNSKAALFVWMEGQKAQRRLNSVLYSCSQLAITPEDFKSGNIQGQRYDATHYFAFAAPLALPQSQSFLMSVFDISSQSASGTGAAAVGAIVGHEIANIKNRSTLKKQNHKLAEGLDLLESFYPSNEEFRKKIVTKCNQLFTTNLQLVDTVKNRLSEFERAAHLQYLMALTQGDELFLKQYAKFLETDGTMVKIQRMTDYIQASEFHTSMTRFIRSHYKTHPDGKTTLDILIDSERMVDEASSFLAQLPIYVAILKLNKRDYKSTTLATEMLEEIKNIYKNEMTSRGVRL